MEIALIVTFVIVAVIEVLLIIREKVERRGLERSVQALADELRTEAIPLSNEERVFYNDVSSFLQGEAEVGICEMLLDKLPFERLERAYLLILVHELDESNYPRLTQRLNQE